MPLITLQTRLAEVLSEARAIRQYCQSAIAAMAAGAVSANVVIELGQRLEASISGIIEPAQATTGLADYAAMQFQDANFGLNERLAGMKSLFQVAISTALATLPTHSGYLLKDSWLPNGAVSVRQLSTSATADLRASLQAIYDNIPE